MSIADELGKLAELRKQGLLTGVEFDEQKARLLGSGSSSPGASGASNEAPPENYLAYAILVTMFCCLPFGIVAIVKSTAVSTALARGSMEEARKASAETKRWLKYALITGAAVIAVYIIILIIVAITNPNALRGWK